MNTDDSRSVSVSYGYPFREGYGAKCVVTVYSRVPVDAEMAANDFDPDEMVKTRCRLAEVPAGWRSIHYELKLPV